MTLDPVHVDGIADLASAIARTVDADDHGALAETVWEEWLPLSDDRDRPVVEPLGEKRLRAVPVDDAALVERPFPTVHGLDSGTINPTTFKNGLVVDVAQAAMGAVPSDLDLHRSRHLVATVHAADATVDFGTDWTHWDEGYSRRKVLHAPRVNRFAEGVVHALSLYLAEGTHALAHANVVEDLLVLDGPLYPTEVLSWQDREPELRDLTAEATPKRVVANYVRLVEQLISRDVAVAGFVKNPSGASLVRTLRRRGVEAPWADDAALFVRLLERRADGERLTDRLTFTSWFVSRTGTDRVFAADGDAFALDRDLAPDAYEVTFMLVYDPRDDVLFRVEAPRAITDDPDARDRLTRQVVHDVAVARGPPPAIGKADELARIGREETVALRRKFEDRLDSEHVRTYDDVRWAPTEG
ncbi:MAG: DNA double-strand break repair nuclease NurA [Haloferacaceae archaeon]